MALARAAVAAGLVEAKEFDRSQGAADIDATSAAATAKHALIGQSHILMTATMTSTTTASDMLNASTTTTPSNATGTTLIGTRIASER